MVCDREHNGTRRCGVKCASFAKLLFFKISSQRLVWLLSGGDAEVLEQHLLKKTRGVRQSFADAGMGVNAFQTYIG
jgi:hypothetical protein